MDVFGHMATCDYGEVHFARGRRWQPWVATAKKHQSRKLLETQCSGAEKRSKKGRRKETRCDFEARFPGIA